MNAEIRDALPDLINGRLSSLDHATLTAHVESCAPCTAEVALLVEIRAAAPLAPAIDIDRVVAALPLPSAQHSLLALTANDAASDGASVRPTSIGLRRRRPIWGIMASVVVIAAGGLAVMIGNEGDPDDVPSARTVAQAPGGEAGAVIPPVGQAGATPSTDPGFASTDRAVTVASGGPDGTRSGTEPAPAAAMTLISGVNELSDADLELLLSEMDDMQGIPAQEPDPVTLELGNLEGEG